MDAVQQRWDLALRRLRNHLFARDIAPLEDQLLGHCLRLTGEHAAAEDLCQETLLRGFALCQICGGPLNTRAYLFRTATNLWIDLLRRRRMEALLPQHLALQAGPRPSPQDGAAWLDFLGRALTPREFEVFVLRDVHGYTGPETARMLKASEAAVKMAACRARVRIRRLLDDRPQVVDESPLAHACNPRLDAEDLPQERGRQGLGR